MVIQGSLLLVSCAILLSGSPMASSTLVYHRTPIASTSYYPQHYQRAPSYGVKYSYNRPSYVASPQTVVATPSYVKTVAPATSAARIPLVNTGYIPSQPSAVYGASYKPARSTVTVSQSSYVVPQIQQPVAPALVQYKGKPFAGYAPVYVQAAPQIQTVLPVSHSPSASTTPVVRPGSAKAGTAGIYSYAYTIQDEAGNLQTRKEESDGSGTVTGSYSYVDPTGIYRKVRYVADENGFRASLSSSQSTVSKIPNKQIYTKVPQTSTPYAKVPLIYSKPDTVLKEQRISVENSQTPAYPTVSSVLASPKAIYAITDASDPAPIQGTAKYNVPVVEKTEDIPILSVFPQVPISSVGSLGTAAVGSSTAGASATTSFIGTTSTATTSEGATAGFAQLAPSPGLTSLPLPANAYFIPIKITPHDIKKLLGIPVSGLAAAAVVAGPGAAVAGMSSTAGDGASMGAGGVAAGSGTGSAGGSAASGSSSSTSSAASSMSSGGSGTSAGVSV